MRERIILNILIVGGFLIVAFEEDSGKTLNCWIAFIFIIVHFLVICTCSY
jgi:hypothetical protein